MKQLNEGEGEEVVQEVAKQMREEEEMSEEEVVKQMEQEEYVRMRKTVATARVNGEFERLNSMKARERKEEERLERVLEEGVGKG